MSDDETARLRAEIERLRLLADGHSACAAGLAEELATVRVALVRVAGERDTFESALEAAEHEHRDCGMALEMLRRERDAARARCASVEVDARGTIAATVAALDAVERERDEARAALRACALRCERCDGVATRVVGVAGAGSSMHRRVCDAPACVLGLSEHDTVSRDLPNATALRACGATTGEGR